MRSGVIRTDSRAISPNPSARSARGRIWESSGGGKELDDEVIVTQPIGAKRTGRNIGGQSYDRFLLEMTVISGSLWWYGRREVHKCKGLEMTVVSDAL
jgi:hypothetical protein